MFSKLFLLALLPLVSAFTASTSRAVKTSLLSMADKSVALPFLTKPPKLDGTAPGDFGFDPLGFTNTLQDLRYVKQAEIKHGRVAMLAVVGFLVSQYVHVPGEAYQAADPMKAIDSVGLGCNLQILAGRLNSYCIFSTLIFDRDGLF